MEKAKCSKCGWYKPVTEFHKRSDRPSGHQSCCSTCTLKQIAKKYKEDHDRLLAQARVNRAKNHDQLLINQYDRRIQKEYGINRQQFNTMLKAQKGLCAICRQPETNTWRGVVRKLSIDHNHATGKVRKLLCSLCNTGIGKFKESPTLLAAASRYIRKHSKPTVVEDINLPPHQEKDECSAW